MARVILLVEFILFTTLCHAGLLDKLKCRIGSRGAGCDSSSSSNPSPMATEMISTASINPVIILPGNGGSQLQARLDRTNVRNKLCPSRTIGFENIWADLDMLIPTLVDCWVDNLRLIYDKVTRKTTSPDGVIIQVPGFGTTETVEYLTRTKLPSSRYLADMVDMLVDHGYVRGVSVRAAPYDFRLAMAEQEDYYNDLKKLVEETYEMNKQRKIVFIAHSYGNLMLGYFLNHQPQEWKDKYVSSFIGMGGPWAGSIKPMKAVATGDDFGIAIVSGSKISTILKSSPSITLAFPSKHVWAMNETLVMNGRKTYTLSNIKEFFDDLNHPEGYEIYLDTKPQLDGLSAPGVPLYCISGDGTPTPQVLVYKEGDFPRKNPNAVMGDGDGTVNKRSLDYCGSFQKGQTYPVISKVFPGAGHKQMTTDKAVLAYIREILFP